jgi:hypothetical protein
MAKLDYDISISDGTTETGFMLWRDLRTRTPSWSWSYLRDITPPIPTRDYVRIGDKDPNAELVLKIESTHNGFGATIPRIPGTPDWDRYQESDGIYAEAHGQISLDNQMVGAHAIDTSEATITIGAFDTEVGSWTTHSGWATLARDTAEEKTGEGCLKAVADSSPSTGDTVCERTNMDFATSGSSTTATLTFQVKEIGPGSPAVRAVMTRDGTNNGSAVTLSGTYQSVSVAHTGTGAISAVKLETTNSVGDAVYYVDDITITYTPAAAPATVVALREYAGDLYMAADGGVFKFHTTNLDWDPVWVSTTAVTDMEVFEGVLYVARGNASGVAADYDYFDGADWVDSSLTGAASKATYFTRVRNTLWKANEDNTQVNEVFSSINPKEGGSWSSAYTVGEEDRDITALFSLNDALAVGREDGLWDYDRAANLFTDVTPEFNFSPDPENFAVGMARFGWLYVATRRGFIRWDRSIYEDLHDLLCGDHTLSDFSGRVKAIGFDGRVLYLISDTPETDTSSSKKIWLLSMTEPVADPLHPDREANRSRLVVHTHHELAIGDISAAYVFGDYLYIGGPLNSVARTFRMKLPTQHHVPARDHTPALPTSGTQALTTMYYDYGLPDVPKAFTKFTLEHENLTSDRTVVVQFRTDEDTSWTALGTANSSSANQTTFNFEDVSGQANRIGRKIQFRFILATNSATASPFCLPAMLRAVLAPADGQLRQYAFSVVFGGPTRTGDIDLAQTGGDAVIRGYITQQWPVILNENLTNPRSTTAATVKIKTMRPRWVELPQETGMEVMSQLVYDVVAIESDVD